MIKEIEKLSQELNLPEYDVLLIGDGSGTISTKCSAWSCFRYFSKNKKLQFHFGTNSFGTNNFAELFSYFSVLWLDVYEGHATPRRVQIISDSELTVKHGTREYSRNSSLILWSGLDYLESMGYNIMWKHVGRNSNLFNSLCDKQAGRLRKEMEGFRLTADKEVGRIE